MSLCVYLVAPGIEHETCACPHCEGSTFGECVFDWNITHNLGAMAREAGIYVALWRPDENGMRTAADIIAPLEAGLTLLLDEPARFEAMNPENGWGSYDGLVGFVRRYLDACRKNPDCIIRVSR